MTCTMEKTENAVKSPEESIFYEPTSNHMCSICREEYTDKCYIMDCLHPFCYQCIHEWQKVKQECPLCRQQIEMLLKISRKHMTPSEYATTRMQELLRSDGIHTLLNNTVFFVKLKGPKYQKPRARDLRASMRRKQEAFREMERRYGSGSVPTLQDLTKYLLCDWRASDAVRSTAGTGATAPSP